MIELDDVEAAADRIAGVATRTPVLRSRTLDERIGAEVLLKAEVFQRTGSFKFRGAYNRIAAMPARERAAGVLAFSSGNHAQAVALAASLFGIPATIVMPADAPEAKRAATRGYGAEIVTYDRFSEDREAIGLALAAERGLAVVRPFDDRLVIAGQGTVGLELVQEVGALDVLVAPVSGGGLIAGCGTAVAARCPRVRIVGVEPADGDDHARSLAAGERVRVSFPRTIADALGAPAPGELTWQVNRKLLAAVETVTDEELLDAMRFAFERLKVVLEPGGAAGLAALLAGRMIVRPGERVGVVLSGGNVGAERFAELMRRGASSAAAGSAAASSAAAGSAAAGSSETGSEGGA